MVRSLIILHSLFTIKSWFSISSLLFESILTINQLKTEKYLFNLRFVLSEDRGLSSQYFDHILLLEIKSPSNLSCRPIPVAS